MAIHDSFHIAEGFPNQRMVGMPLPLAESAAHGVDAFDYISTAIGHFPSAKNHYVQRERGAAEFVLIACVNGGGQVSIGTRVHKVGAGDIIVLPPNIAHSYRADPHDPWTIYWLHLGGRRASSAAHWLTESTRSKVSASRFSAAAIAAFENTYSACAQACASGDASIAAISTGYLISQLAYGRTVQVASQGRIERVLHMMERRINATVSVKELARLVDLSPSHLAWAFKRRTGTSVLNYFIRLKMQRAATMLDTTTLPIQQIARQLGYEDSLYFSRQFRTVYECSPGQYRSITKG